VTKLIHLLGHRDKTLPTEKEKQTKCEKCGKRQATSQDGLCDSCRYDDAITRMIETR